MPWEIQKQVFAIYPHVLEATLHDMQEVTELPNHLQDLMYQHIKLHMLKGVPLLQNMSLDCAVTLCDAMPRVIGTPSEYIVREGEAGDCMFFLVRGMVEVLVTDSESKEPQMLCTLQDGSWFGEIALVKVPPSQLLFLPLPLCHLPVGELRISDPRADLALGMRRAFVAGLSKEAEHLRRLRCTRAHQIPQN